MKAIISSTHDDLYFFFLPIVTWSWNKLGIDVICMMPNFASKSNYDIYCDWLHKSNLAHKTANCQFHYFDCLDHKAATYAQCSRLYGATLDLPENEILITSDVDMAVFSNYFDHANNGQINVFGADLVPPNQYPMCYVAMPVKTWREVMWITPGVPVQKYLDDLLGHIECEHFRANQWAKDQDEIWTHLIAQAWPVVKHFRASPGTQFATRRADRDGWPETIPPDIIDAHLPRPGFTDDNFAKILKLFQDIYPNEDFAWMVEYRNEYVKLL